MYVYVICYIQLHVNMLATSSCNAHTRTDSKPRNRSSLCSSVCADDMAVGFLGWGFRGLGFRGSGITV